MMTLLSGSHIALAEAMMLKLSVILLSTISMRATAQELCASDSNRQWSSNGYCLTVQEPAQVSEDEKVLLNKKLTFLRQRFPLLYAKIQDNGYRRIVLKAPQTGENGGAVLAQVLPDQKLIVIYGGYFSILKDAPVLSDLQYSVADISLLHELLHAYDDSSILASANLSLLGWSYIQEAPTDSFRFSADPRIFNLWVGNSEVSRIKSELAPLLPKLGPWEIYLRARNQIKKFGYPSIYSVLGGPVESFAELGAYIALDPEASSYIKPDTFKWFQDTVLK